MSNKAITKSYLLTQLKNFYEKIIEPNIPTNLVDLGQGYGTCSTDAETTDKVAELSDYELKRNGIISIKFANDVPASSTLNINSKGSKAIYHRGAVIEDKEIQAGDTATFMYDGTKYILLAVDTTHVTSSMVAELFNNVEFSIDVSSGKLILKY